MACQYKEICNLPPITPGHKYCWLHDTRPGKDPSAFKGALDQYIQSGNTNFQHMFFPDPEKNIFYDVEFATQVDFSHASFPDGLHLKKACLKQAPFIDVEDDLEIQLVEETIIHGNTQIVVNGTLRKFSALNAIFLGDLIIRFRFGYHLNLGAEFQGDVKISGFVVDPFGKPGAGYLKLMGAKIHKNLCLSTCTVQVPCLFENLTWEPSSSLNLAKAIFNHGIMLDGPSCPPKIDITNTIFEKKVTIGPTYGQSLTIIEANPNPPIFKNENSNVIFTNVDLTQCRLLGNNFTHMEFINVTWPKWHRRICLFDEMFFRSFSLYLKYNNPQTWDYGVRNWLTVLAKKAFFHSILKEHYQALKQMYLNRGDHPRSGDFHYGEMEMKRREYGWPFRILCLEFVYLVLSGYGTRPLRAFMVLVLMCLVPAWGYLSLSPNTFGCDSLEGLHFSLEVMTFQRPEIPSSVSPLTKPAQWLKTFQAVLGPVQIALFGLSLRMRLKR